MNDMNILIIAIASFFITVLGYKFLIVWWKYQNLKYEEELRKKFQAEWRQPYYPIAPVTNEAALESTLSTENPNKTNVPNWWLILLVSIFLIWGMHYLT